MLDCCVTSSEKYVSYIREENKFTKECGNWDRVIDLLKFRFSQEKIRCIVYGQVTRLPRRYQRTIIASNSTLVTTENNFIWTEAPGIHLRPNIKGPFVLFISYIQGHTWQLFYLRKYSRNRPVNF